MSIAEPNGRGKVLVVDDDPALAEMLAIVLRNEGFDSRLCATGTVRWPSSATTARTSCCWT